MILIFGASRDPHVQAVAAHLRASGAAHGFFDLYDPDCDGIACNVGASGRVTIGDGLDASMIRSVWWRLKPPERIVTDDIVAYYDQSFSFNEWAGVAGYVADLLTRCFWINRRDAERKAANKLHQSEAARRAGFNVPATLFTNSPTAARTFLHDHGRVVMKTFLPYLSPDLRQCHTRAFSAQLLDTLGESFGQCPVILQKHVEPAHELRVTVVGDRVFPARIDAKRERHPDWRLESDDDIFRSVALDPAVGAALIALNRALGLEFGCHDLIMDGDGTLWFIEVNPAGQWLWLEDRLGLPISAEIARKLAAGR